MEKNTMFIDQITEKYFNKIKEEYNLDGKTLKIFKETSKELVYLFFATIVLSEFLRIYKAFGLKEKYSNEEKEVILDNLIISIMPIYLSTNFDDNITSVLIAFMYSLLTKEYDEDKMLEISLNIGEKLQKQHSSLKEIFLSKKLSSGIYELMGFDAPKISKSDISKIPGIISSVQLLISKMFRVYNDEVLENGNEQKWDGILREFME